MSDAKTCPCCGFEKCWVGCLGANVLETSERELSKAAIELATLREQLSAAQQSLANARAETERFRQLGSEAVARSEAADRDIERLARERDEFERKVHVFWGECVETVIQAEERAEKTEAERDAARADRRAYGERVRGLFYEHIKRDDEEEQAFLEALAALEDKP